MGLIFFIAFIVACVIIYMIVGIDWKKTTQEADPVLKEKKLAKLKEQYQQLETICDEEADSENKTSRQRVETNNSTCPICHSTYVNDRIKRVQGKMDGHIEGSSFLFSGSLYGSVHGSLDTNEVNKCNECQHEWKKKQI